MKFNHLLKFSFLAFVATIISSGCVGISPSTPNNKNNTNLKYSSGEAFAYAYMKGGTKLSYITFSYEIPADGYEVIKIKGNGFSPDYTMNNEVSLGSKSPGCLVVMDEKDENYKFCKSNYTRRTVLGTGTSAIWNTAATFTTVGLNLASGAVVDPKFFDQDKFLEIVKDNELEKIQPLIYQIISLENMHNKELSSLYDKEMNEYNENKKNISFSYSYNDESGLLFGKKFEHDIKIKDHNPARNLLSYKNNYEKEKFTSISNLESYINNLKNELNNKFSSIKSSYENEYLKQIFNEYSFYINEKNYLKVNDKISFNTDIITPANLKYENGKKKVIPVKIIIKSANINNLSPNNLILSDKNIDVDFNNLYQTSVTAIVSNKTNSFLTIKSLTSYVNSNVNTLSNIINKEVAPDSRTLQSNSSYNLFTNDMVKEFNFTNVNKKDLSNKYLSYGFAIKYHIQDSNLEKTIYENKKFSYLELFKDSL